MAPSKSSTAKPNWILQTKYYSLFWQPTVWTGAMPKRSNMCILLVVGRKNVLLHFTYFWMNQTKINNRLLSLFEEGLVGAKRYCQCKLHISRLYCRMDRFRPIRSLNSSNKGLKKSHNRYLQKHMRRCTRSCRRSTLVPQVKVWLQTIAAVEIRQTVRNDALWQLFNYTLLEPIQVGRCKKTCQILEQNGRVSIGFPCFNVWSVGPSSAPFRQWKGATCYSPDCRRYHLRVGRTERRLLYWYLPTGQFYVCAETCKRGVGNFEYFRCPQEGKARFTINLKQQSGHWDKRSVSMDTLSAFGSCLCEGDRLLSFDWSSAYRHMALHSGMWDWILFKYNRLCYRYISVPVGKAASPFWFVKLLSPVTRYMQSKLEFRVLVWLNNYLIASGNGIIPRMERDCLLISQELDKLFSSLGLLRHQTKGVWRKGAKRLEHLGLIIDAVAFCYFVSDTKLIELRGKAQALLKKCLPTKSMGKRKCFDKFWCTGYFSTDTYFSCKIVYEKVMRSYEVWLLSSSPIPRANDKTFPCRNERFTVLVHDAGWRWKTNWRWDSIVVFA